MVTFTPESPGRIMVFDLQAGQSLICQKDAFMVAQEGVQIEIHFRRRLGAGLFGGEGFILQRVTGPGVVFLEIAGDVREYALEPGEMMRVDPGHIALYEPTVDYDITTVKGSRTLPWRRGTLPRHSPRPGARVAAEHAHQQPGRQAQAVPPTKG